ncbi:uncharacterized protein LOC131939035 [Physella acuta]|uniref:uncharacterized protein LOC131939035 n=1 Tax=Physella acuta TaxID=109671 RepID=UPI0027DAE552|nr:uncharacterized protein LOC131939035 [Physella acuta]
MITNVIVVICVCFFTCVQAQCCKSQHICLMAFINSEESNDGICRGISGYFKCSVNIENTEAAEFKYILELLMEEAEVFPNNCSVDSELSLFLNEAPEYLSEMQPKSTHQRYPVTANVCLTTYLETLGAYFNNPSLICQALSAFLYCNQVTLNEPMETVNDVIAVFKEELSKFQLNCEITSELITTSCETATNACLVGYFHTVLHNTCSISLNV